MGSKTTALLGRALPRDFIDVAAALDRYSRRQLLELAFTRDRGLRAADAALAAQHLDRLQDEQFAPYQLTGDDISALRKRFASWPRDAASDHEAHAAHEAVHPPPTTAAERAAAGFPTARQRRAAAAPAPVLLTIRAARPTAVRRTIATPDVTTPRTRPAPNVSA